MSLLKLTAMLLSVLSAATALTRRPHSVAVADDTSPKVLIVYYSFTADGCTARMAKEVEAGALAANATVKTLPVNETTCDDVSWADAVIIGSPVHFANPASDITKFFEDLQNVCFGWPLVQLEKKVGGAFVDGGGQDKGKDTTLQSIHGALMSMRFVVRGCNNGTCNAWGATATNLDHPGQPGKPLTTDEVAACQDLGAVITELAAIIWH